MKFTERGEVLVEVSLLPRDAAGPLLEFSVSDTGIGIPPEKQARIFEAFVQADGSTTRQYGGTGLGLSIAAQLVERMGGQISVESAPGRGSRFRFSVRFAAAARGRPPARPPKRLRGLRVLVVDDNETNRRILEEVLAHWQLRPRAVGGAPEALAELERAARARRPYALVLLDANMPQMDGFDLAELIRNQPHLAGASIMMLSSGVRPGERERCVALGIAAHLTKPVKQSDLMDALVLALHPEGVVAAEQPGADAARGPSLRVLVAEDNLVNQQVAASMLKRAGHRAVVAGNGREVLALLQREAFDLILMDVQMPELDGLETTAAIRERERAAGGHVPIVALTAHAMKGDAEKCLAAGMDGYLAKPLHPRELAAAIAGALSGGQPLPEPPAGGGTEPEEGTIDVARVLERVGGDVRSLTRIVRIFRADYPAQLGRIREALTRGDHAGVRAAAHALKGSVGNFAAPRASAATLRLQQMGEERRLEGAAAALEELERELSALADALAAIVRRPRGSARRAAPQHRRRR